MIKVEHFPASRQIIYSDDSCIYPPDCIEKIQEQITDCYERGNCKEVSFSAFNSANELIFFRIYKLFLFDCRLGSERRIFVALQYEDEQILGPEIDISTRKIIGPSPVSLLMASAIVGGLK